MPEKKFHIGDSVWFKYDDGRKEQKGTIQMTSGYLYYILGNVTHECYSVKEGDISLIAPHLRTTSKYQVDTWVYFKGPNKKYYQGIIKEYDPTDGLYKIEYFTDGNFVKNFYALDREILNFKFKSGDEIEFKYNVKWQRGKIQQCYADKDGQIFYDIYPWDEKVRAYNSLRGYKEIFESNVRPLNSMFLVTTSGFKGGKIPWECKDSISTADYLSDYFRYFPKFSFPTVSDSVLLGIDTDSIKVKKEDNMNNKPRNHKFVKTNEKERRIKEVIFNGPATIIKWEPTMDDYIYGKCKGDKTVSVCGVTDPYDKEKGFLLAVIKEFVDNQSYDNILRMIDSFNEERK